MFIEHSGEQLLDLVICGGFGVAFGIWLDLLTLLTPIREEAQRLLADKAYLEQVYRSGAERASAVAERTLRKVYKKVGFVER